ncbi:MAG: hypothetical protein V3U75_13040 [Methylococcaceae bacterium]
MLFRRGIFAIVMALFFLSVSLAATNIRKNPLSDIVTSSSSITSQAIDTGNVGPLLASHPGDIGAHHVSHIIVQKGQDVATKVLACLECGKAVHSCDRHDSHSKLAYTNITQRTQKTTVNNVRRSSLSQFT